MEQIKYYLDEHIHSAVAEGLRRRGVDVLTVQEAARAGLTDEEQLSFARTEERVVVTMDSDYLVLAAGGVPNAGNRLRKPEKNRRRIDRRPYAVERRFDS